MKRVSAKRLGGIVAGSVVGLVAAAVPASALGITIGTPTGSLVHVADCRSVALDRAVGYDLDFSSNTTGPMVVHVGAVVDASMTLCWDLDVKAVSSVKVVTETYGTVEGAVNGLVTGSDGSGICTAIRLTVGPGVDGTVTATTHAHVAVDGAPPADWDNVFAEDLELPTVGEDITLRSCVDSSGSVSTS